MCSEVSFLQFAELQTDQGTLIFPVKNCSLDTFSLSHSFRSACLEPVQSMFTMHEV